MLIFVIQTFTHKINSHYICRFVISLLVGECTNISTIVKKNCNLELPVWLSSELPPIKQPWSKRRSRLRHYINLLLFTPPRSFLCNKSSRLKTSFGIAKRGSFWQVFSFKKFHLMCATLTYRNISVSWDFTA